MEQSLINIMNKLLEADKHKIPAAEKDWIYLIHHLHRPENENEMETLHHCVLWEKKNEGGKNWKQRHIKDVKIFQHVLVTKTIDEIPPIVYDHLNNGFKIKIVYINNKEYPMLNGLKNIKKTKWSNQDR